MGWLGGAEGLAVKVHELKTWPEHWADVAANKKTHEVRQNDRDFAVGDVLCLQEYDRATGKWTGKFVFRRVKHVLHGGEHGVEAGYVVLSLGRMNHSTTSAALGVMLSMERKAHDA